VKKIDVRHKIKALRKEVLGHYPKVAEKAKCSTATVCKVLNGEYVDQVVIAAAIEVRDELKKEEQASSQSLVQLMEKI
jgi:DNA-binding LacI/PurR family transcriptional regulator